MYKRGFLSIGFYDFLTKNIWRRIITSQFATEFENERLNYILQIKTILNSYNLQYKSADSITICTQKAILQGRSAGFERLPSSYRNLKEDEGEGTEKAKKLKFYN